MQNGVGRLKRQDLFKLHATVTGVLKVISRMEVIDGETNDSRQLGILPKTLDDMEALAANSCYLSRRNCDLIEVIGTKLPKA